MNFSFLLFSLIMLVAGVLFIATSSIAIQCGNDHEGYYESLGEHKTFLIVTLVSAILVTLLSFPGMVLAFQSY